MDIKKTPKPILHKMGFFFRPRPIVAEKKPKRNDLCTCGSGKKFKKCCGIIKEHILEKKRFINPSPREGRKGVNYG